MSGADEAIEEMRSHGKLKALEIETEAICYKLHAAVRGHSGAAIIVAVSTFIISAPGYLGTSIRASLGMDDRTMPDIDKANQALKDWK